MFYQDSIYIITVHILVALAAHITSVILKAEFNRLFAKEMAFIINYQRKVMMQDVHIYIPHLTINIVVIKDTPILRQLVSKVKQVRPAHWNEEEDEEDEEDKELMKRKVTKLRKMKVVVLIWRFIKLAQLVTRSLRDIRIEVDIAISDIPILAVLIAPTAPTISIAPTIPATTTILTILTASTTALTVPATPTTSAAPIALTEAP
ncbi:hypothetical protein EW146_g3151 [Bondarzewia mesenterica]|uniref:Uncharacterized protein n=1 Tax=Bondarzewia mesenterica TaxID=1095465 RepID=A0A4S4M098_9AGAM|nr:hypothetical protein EW146_g3151 [Bondarzewia mesenterica]